jgi:iron-sulfur cluster repair protein YtfE (RIC family)
MKRHPALQDLSRDHFHVLFRCQRLRRALADPSAEVLPLLQEFLVFFDSDMSPHFAEEDELVVPLAAQERSLQAVATRTRDEHKELRHKIIALRSVRSEADARRAVGGLEPQITEHVQMEEAQLFEGVQNVLSAQTMDELARRSLEFRRRHRHPDSIGPRAGRG